MKVLHQFLIAIFWLLLCSTTQADIVLGVVDDFQDSTTEGWQHQQGNAFMPTNMADAGPGGTGDHALRLSSSGLGGAGSRFIAFNSAADWLGNYIGAGVTGIQFQVNNTGNNDLNLRFALNGPGGWFITTPIAVAAGGGWQTPQMFDISSGALLAVGGATDVNATLTNVSQAQLMSAVGIPTVGARPRGDIIAATALFDNLTAVPEPAGLGILSLVIGWIAFPRSRRA